MGFNSADIVKGEDYTCSFYVKKDDGIFNHDLTFANGTYEIKRLDDEASVLVVPLAMDLGSFGYHKAIFNLSGAESSMLLDRTVEGEEDQYLKRSGYYGKIIINNVLASDPVLAIVNKINVL